jgi:hypothetical protein
MKLDLNNPIFVFYINTENMSRQSAEQLLNNTREMADIYDNATMWILTTKNETRVECIYNNSNSNRNLEGIISEINERIEILSNSNSFEDFKINIRDWRIKEVLKKSEKE